MTIIVRNERDYDLRTALRIHGMWLSGGMTLLGLQLLRPETTFMQPIYAGMRQVANEDVWTFFMLLFGAPRLCLILWGVWSKNGVRVIPPLAIVFLSGGCSMIWLAVALLFLKTNPLGISCVAFAILCGIDLSTCVLTAKLAGSQWRGDGDGRKLS